MFENTNQTPLKLHFLKVQFLYNRQKLDLMILCMLKFGYMTNTWHVFADSAPTSQFFFIFCFWWNPKPIHYYMNTSNKILLIKIKHPNQTVNMISLIMCNVYLVWWFIKWLGGEWELEGRSVQHNKYREWVVYVNGIPVVKLMWLWCCRSWTYCAKTSYCVLTESQKRLWFCQRLKRHRSCFVPLF